MLGNRYHDDLLAKFSPHLQGVSPNGPFAHLQANEQEKFQILEMKAVPGGWETSHFRKHPGLG